MMRCFFSKHRVLTCLGILAIFAALGWLCLPKPPLLDGIPFSQRIYDRHGTLLRMTLTSDEKFRVYTPLSQISPELIHATLAYEDRYYEEHPGVNPVAIARSAWALLLHGRAHSGASTLTMQVARLRFQLRTKTFGGKCMQIFRALQLERHYGKEQILEAYFNLAPYGRNIEGAAAASLLYFRKTPDHLTLPEAATLSVIPQSPSRRALSRDRDNPALAAAQARLFAKIAPNAEAAAFRARMLGEPPFFAPHFVQTLLQRNAKEREVVSTLDLDLQRLFERQCADYLSTRRDRGLTNAVILLVDTRKMELLASVGSADFFNRTIRGQVDGSRARRSPGSTLKPFIYALALDQGLIHPLSILADAPRRFSGYNPENFDRDFTGPIRACDALVRSRNIPAIALSAKLANPSLYELLRMAGVHLSFPPWHYGLTLALGGAEVSSMELAGLYGALANDGRFRPVQTRFPLRQEVSARLFSPESAFLIREMLGSSGSLFSGERDTAEPVQWKTGTSNGFRDAWTAAIFGQYALIVWIGNFDGRANPSFVGRAAAAPLAFRLIDVLRTRGLIEWRPNRPPEGANLRTVEFCAVSGQLPLDCCKERTTGWFIPGVSPIGTCAIHREVIVDNTSGLRLSVDDGTRSVRREVYEFWPAELLELFAQAGLPRRLPPPFLPGCGPVEASVVDTRREPVKIRSPHNKATYIFRTAEEKNRGITLSADCPGDATALYWFAGKEFLGKAQRGETLIWHPLPGDYEITALDEMGGSDTLAITVGITTE